ncbi:tetratricopeptide repeat protein [Legionella geestiana]|uniref:tetratricopeptide repeat protein n=1 Tax=Legionella geestiana TaxID=45065 RepID=UPI001C9E3577|nr:tetratricopeptide repeat protein [Legionella geestiana]
MKRTLLLFLLLSPPVFALSWDSLWQTPNQKAQTLMQKGDFAGALKQFEQPDWHASAAYRAGAFIEAAKSFEALDTATGYYNAGNARAQAGQYQEALANYDKALSRDPGLEDARFNRTIVEKLLKEQQQDKQQQDKQQQDKQQQDKQQQDKQQQDKQQQDKQQQETQKTNARWLQLIPDDPGGLLREKFQRDHWRRQRGWNP